MMWTILGIIHIIALLYFIYGCFEHEAYYMYDKFERKDLIMYAGLRVVYYIGAFFALAGIGYVLTQ